MDITEESQSRDTEHGGCYPGGQEDISKITSETLPACALPKESVSQKLGDLR